MMGDWGLTWNAQEDTVADDQAVSAGTVLTASASTNTKGAWAQLVAATPIDAHAIAVIIRTNTADQMMDIAVGPAGQEHVIVPNLITGDDGKSGSRPIFYLPISIPKGSRLSGRNQSTTGGALQSLIVMLMNHGSGASPPMGRITDYGTAVADSGGTGVDPGATLNTKNSWAELVAATSWPIRALVMAIGNQNNSARTTATWLLDIAVGAAGQEHAIIPDIILSANSSGDLMQPPVLGPFPVAIPPGSRITARAQCNISDATDRLFDVAVYGVN